MTERLRIAINTGGGDAPGLNAVIFAVALSAYRRGWEVHGIQTTTFDRLLALGFGAAAVRLIAEGKRNVMVTYHPPEMTCVPIPDVVSKTKLVPLDSDTILTCRDLGISFGD